MSDLPETEEERLALVCDLLDRYLAGELDRRELTDWATILRLRGDWLPTTDSAASRLLMVAAHHLFMFERGDWPEETLRDSLGLSRERAGETGYLSSTPMFDAQWIALLRAGHIPPGAGHSEMRSLEEMRAAAEEHKRRETWDT